MKLKYYGHSCFTVENNGYVVCLDPFDPSVPGYEPLKIKADAVYCSHGHNDHAYTDAVELSGTAALNPFKLTEFVIPHDDVNGSKRGMNTVRIFEADGKSIAHLGDMGCMPDDNQINMLKNIDVMLIPVGGTFTVDAEQANELVRLADPKLAIPMHYRDKNYGLGMIKDISDLSLSDKFRILQVGEEIEL